MLTSPCDDVNRVQLKFALKHDNYLPARTPLGKSVSFFKEDLDYILSTSLSSFYPFLCLAMCPQVLGSISNFTTNLTVLWQCECDCDWVTRVHCISIIQLQLVQILHTKLTSCSSLVILINSINYNTINFPDARLQIIGAGSVSDTDSSFCHSITWISQ